MCGIGRVGSVRIGRQQRVFIGGLLRAVVERSGATVLSVLTMLSEPANVAFFIGIVLCRCVIALQISHAAIRSISGLACGSVALATLVIVGDPPLPVHDVGGRGHRHGMRAAVRQRRRPIGLLQRPAVGETVIPQVRFFERKRAGSLTGCAMRRGPCPVHIVVETTHPVRSASASVRSVAQLCQRSRE